MKCKKIHVAGLLTGLLLLALARLLKFGMLPVLGMDKNLFCGPLPTQPCSSIMYDIMGLTVSVYVFTILGLIFVGAALSQYIFPDFKEGPHNNQRATF